MATVERLCPRQAVLYNCSFQAQMEPMQLTWNVMFPGKQGLTITYQGNSMVNDIQTFGTGVQSSLTRHRQNEYIESVLILELSSDIGPSVRCTINDLQPVELNLPVSQGMIFILLLSISLSLECGMPNLLIRVPGY